MSLIVIKYTLLNCLMFNVYNLFFQVFYSITFKICAIKSKTYWGMPDCASTDNRFERARIIRFRIALATAQI